MGSLTALLAPREVGLDGGLATELEARGHDLRDRLWSARLLRDDPQAIEDVHVAYFEAGADVAITASYHATFEGFEAAGVGRDEGAALLRLSVELARRARARAGGSGLVAGSLGPYAVVFADDTEYTGDYRSATDEQIASSHRARIAELVAAGADLLAVETIPNGREAAILAELLEEFPGIEAWVTFCCRDGEHLSDGTPIGDAIRSAGRTGRVAAFGVDCTRAAARRVAARCGSAGDRPAARRLPELGPGLGRRHLHLQRRRCRPLLPRACLALARPRRAGDRRLLRHRPGGHRRAGLAMTQRAGSDIGLRRMPDAYANIQEAEAPVQERLADVQELRAADPKQQAMLASYLGELDLPADARVLEIGCGSGAIARVIARREGVGEVVGVDPSDVFLARARRLAEDVPNLTFAIGDGRNLAYDDDSFDAVVCHTVLSHALSPEKVLAEAARVVVPGGRLPVFDRDYATTTVAITENDPCRPVCGRPSRPS